MGFDYVDDTATMDLDQCLMENHIRHRSPIIHLPELFMYDYSYEDVLECAGNFKSSIMDNNDDPVANTINYYTKKYADKIKPAALEAITDIIQQNLYSIFHIDRGGTTYLASLKKDNPTVCIDSVCLTWNQLPDNAYDMQVMWQTGNKTMTFDDFAKQLFTKFHDEDYVMNKNLQNILKSNPERKERFDKMPAYIYSYAVEEFSTNYDLDLYDDMEPATEAPMDDALNNLEEMSDDERQPRNGRRRNRSTATTEDDTRDAQAARTVDIAQATNDRMTQNGGVTSEELANDEEGEAPPPEDAEGAPPEEGGEEAPPEETDEDTLPEEEDDPIDEKEYLDNPESKETYRKRFIALYKHINDIIETMENFTPAYDMKCTSQYYAIQNDIHRLKTAIYKICTEKLKGMKTVDVMKAYLAANYAYDTIGEMLKEFFATYTKERKLKNGKKDKL